MGFFSCIFSPKLFKDYKNGSPKDLYEPVGLEKISEQILSTFNLMWSIGYYTSPVILSFLYRRGYFALESVSSLAKFTTGIGMLVIISMCMRGLGRTKSLVYSRFVKTYVDSSSHPQNKELRKALREFDYEFKYWPVDWVATDVSLSGKVKPRKVMPFDKRPTNSGLIVIPYEVAAYLAIHSFGLRMIYPGSLKMFQNYFHPMLVESRQKMIMDHGGVRNKLLAVDGNEIDTMFVDNRDKGPNGKTLVICSEGNAGFYEIGICSTPLELNYSVMGWNHPGFGGSTGKPFPGQDSNAVDAVILFAVNKLNFAVENILLFGWSIGGYSTIYGAVRYPKVKGIILDASFDDLVPLALPRMPNCLSGIVEYAVRKYVNLDNSELLKQFKGPVFIIRRTEDEVIAEDFKMETNRGNYLLLKMLTHRFPNIFTSKALEHFHKQLRKPIDHNEERGGTSNLEADQLNLSLLTSFIADTNQNNYPVVIGKDYTDEQRISMGEYLIRRHFSDYKSSHCTPLPTDFFQMPWELPTDTDFVFT